ncbi:TPA: hypothetical protein ACOEOM_002668, partial [Stenotrophomonas maltophilia]
MKDTTRMAATLAAALSLSGQIASAQEAAQPNPESGKPGFFRQLGKSLKDAGGQMIGVKPTGATASQASGNQPIYAPVSGSGKIQGLFQGDNHQLAQQGRLEWPRVALTFQEWGVSMPCWTVEAKIWTSANASTVETFRTCADAALTVVDDLGDMAELNTAALWKGRDSLTGVRVPSNKANTGA